MPYNNKQKRMMIVMSRGFVIMSHEKLHVLFGLILMTQYFTSVSTSVSLLSSSSSLSSEASDQAQETRDKASLSSSMSAPSSSSKSMLLSAPSSHHHPSSTHLLWPAARTVLRKQHHSSRSSHSHLTMPYSFHHHLIPQSENDLRLSLMLDKIDDEPIMKISPSSKHQKRHVGCENCTSIRHGGGSDGINNQRKLVRRENAAQVNAVDSHGQIQLMSTSKSPTILLSDGAVIEGGTANSSSPYNQGNNNIDISRSDSVGRKNRNRDSVGMCRFRVFMPRTPFLLETCGWCYQYMKDDPNIFGTPTKKLNYTLGRFYDQETDNTYIIYQLKFNGTRIFANVSDPDSPIWETFANEKARKDWTGCCHAAKKCCDGMIASSNILTNETELDGPMDVMDNTSSPVEAKCPPTWDGWQCWTSTTAGVTAKSYCPNYVYFLTEPPTCLIPLDKECSANGTWFRKRGKEWTNYATCSMSKVNIQQNRSYVLVIAYGISIVALVPAVIIFFVFKQLRVHRIILHQNLFFSLILNAFLVIIFNTTVMMGETNSINDGSDANSIVRKNGVACRLLLISTKYSRMTNYMWMLCEGFYLHKLIAAAFAEQKSLLVFYLIGWVFPLIPTAIYAGFRILRANDGCWVVPQEEWEWALNGPSLLSLLVNTLFLINIIRVLVTKLRAAHAQEPSQYRKAVRATLVLLPLFGLHFIVTIYRPSSSTGVCQNWTELYFYANDILDGMQGFLVALIFCYCNGEVLSLLKRAYKRWREQHFDVSHRANSRHRPSRGSVLGRSVVSTHIYSSIPPSPETNVIALPGNSNSNSQDPSPTSQPVSTNLLAVNGASGAVTISSNTINNSSPNAKNSESKSSLKNRKNHTSTATNGNAISMYVSSEYGCVKEKPGMEISCV